MQLSEVEEKTLELLSACLSTTHPQVKMEDWDAIKTELKHQAILTVIGDEIAELTISDEQKKEYAVYFMKNLQSFHSIMLEQNELREVLNGIPFVILKGSSAARYYNKPEYRQMGDIDILVCPKDFEEAVVCMRRNGYQIDHDTGRHISFIGESEVSVELHRYFWKGINHPLIKCCLKQ